MLALRLRSRTLVLGTAVAVVATLGLSPASLLPTHRHIGAESLPVIDVQEPPTAEELPEVPKDIPDGELPVVLDEARAEADELAALQVIGDANRIEVLTDDERVAMEAEHDVRIVENEPGLLVLDVLGAEEPLRIAAYEAVTDAGTEVVAVAMLGSEDIEHLEEDEKHHGGSLLGPSPAYGHKTSYNHYHYFWHGSYVLQYANSWNLYVYLAPLDAEYVKTVGSVIAAVIGIAVGHPILGLVGGLAFYTGVWRFQNADGSLTFYVPATSVAQYYGDVYYYAQQAWYYYYSQSSQYFCYALKRLSGVLYYIGCS